MAVYSPWDNGLPKHEHNISGAETWRKADFDAHCLSICLFLPPFLNQNLICSSIWVNYSLFVTETIWLVLLSMLIFHKYKNNKSIHSFIKYFVRTRCSDKGKYCVQNGTAFWEWRHESSKGIDKQALRDFPGFPMVKTPYFHWREHGFAPWLKN